jgi:hypothetical protein
MFYLLCSASIPCLFPRSHLTAGDIQAACPQLVLAYKLFICTDFLVYEKLQGFLNGGKLREHCSGPT